MEDYLENLKLILGEEKYKELYDVIFKQACKRYGRIHNKKIEQIIQYNLAVILIIGIEKGRGCNDSKIPKIIRWYSIGDRSQLICDNLNDFIKQYNEYILIISNIV